MGFFQKLSRLFSPPPQKAEDASYWIDVRCSRCGEVIRARVDLRNDLSIDYNEKGAVSGYYCRKVLMGSGHCYQQIEVALSFGPDHRLVSQEIRGGKFVSEDK
jgi:hypothetical protein